MDKKVREERKVADYQSLSHKDQIYQIPDTYIGSDTRSETYDWVFDSTQNKLVYVKISLPEGVRRLFLEILSNAGDNADASRRMNVNPGTIEVYMDNKWISIKNGGEPIPIAYSLPKKDSSLKISDEEYASNPNNYSLVPKRAFGVLLTSTNYDPTIVRMGCGRNGYGAKLTNIFSKQFIVRVGDPKNGQEYEIIWSENMNNIVSEKCNPGYTWDGRQWNSNPNPYKGPSYVQVMWHLDFERFKMIEYSAEDFALFHRYILDFSLTCKIPITFNNVVYDMRSIRKYASLYWSEDICKNAYIHYEWANGVVPSGFEKLNRVQKENKIAEASTVDMIPIVEMMVLDTPDAGVIFSYVNGLLTIDGGVHVNEALKEIATPLITSINENMNGKKNKDKAKDKNAPKPPTLTFSDVKPHISMILNCRLPDPKYTSQSKTSLHTPKPKITIDDTFTKAISKWELIERLIASFEAKAYKTLAKTDGKKKRRIFLTKGEDANDAGSGESLQCILQLTEGQSASSYPKKRTGMTPAGKDKSGYYPLQGKFVNVSTASFLDLTNEKCEFVAIKKMIGLREGADYNDPKQKAELRYGFILSITDADSDGKHINCLLLNTFHRKWPSLLQQGMFGYLLTPAVRLFDNNDTVVHRFYSESEFNKFNEANSHLIKSDKNKSGKYKVKYYKGLGTSKDKDIKDDLNTAPIILCIYDEQSANNLDLAFAPKMADKRKEWIAKWRGVTQIDDVICIPNSVFRQRSISSIINMDLLDYSLDNLFRAIPSYRDLYKKSQRQALYYILEHWNYGNSEKDSMKVARIAMAAAELTKYHHGENSLMDTIIGLAQDFTGSNNLNVLMKEGQFGCRDEGGADAANGRYSETCPEWFVKYIFHKELVRLVPLRSVQGEEAEPYWIPCDVPLGVINGQQGVATGWSTFIPSHNPYDVINWLINRCENKQTPTLIPWFNGFRGSVKIIQKKKEEEKEEDESIPNEEKEEENEDSQIDTNLVPIRQSKGISLETKGLFEITETYKNGAVDITISELPIKRWLHPYHKWLESLIQEGRLDNFRDKSDTETPLYYLSKFVPETNKEGAKLPVNHTTLKLRKTFGMSNMVLIDDNGFPTHYGNVDLIMEAYFQSMLSLYELYRTNKLNEIMVEITFSEHLKRFIELVVNDKIIVFKRTEADILQQLATYQVPVECYEKTALKDCNNDKINSLQEKINKKKKEYSEIEAESASSLWVRRLKEFYRQLEKRNYGK